MDDDGKGWQWTMASAVDTSTMVYYSKVLPMLHYVWYSFLASKRDLPSIMTRNSPHCISLYYVMSAMECAPVDIANTYSDISMLKEAPEWTAAQVHSNVGTVDDEAMVMTRSEN